MASPLGSKSATGSPLARLRRRRDDILAVAKAHGGRNVRVFGSTARGEARGDSDIDLLIELEPGRSLIDRIAIAQELEALLGRPVDVVTERALSPYLRDAILAEATPL